MKLLHGFAVVFLSLVLMGSQFFTVGAAQSDYNFVEGAGQEISLGNNLAKLTLKEGYFYLDKAETLKLLASSNQPSSGNELGVVVPASAQEDWIAYIEYEELGHISHSDREKLDEDMLLNSYIEGQVASNEELNPEDQLFVDGWALAPKYDTTKNRLVWGITFYDQNQEPLTNYHERILTKDGFISIILACDPATFDATVAKVNADIIPGLVVSEGNRYEEYNETTDKKSDLNLAALILYDAGVLDPGVNNSVAIDDSGAVALRPLAFTLLVLKRGGVIVIAALGIFLNWQYKKKKKQPKNNP